MIFERSILSRIMPSSVPNFAEPEFRYANGVEMWDREYSSLATIPSSHRSQPSHAVKLSLSSLRLRQGSAVDLGCGNGRNAKFLAKLGFEVSALDFSERALDLTQHLIANENTRLDITPILHDIRDGLPFRDSETDLVLDAYCLCHFIDEIGYKKALDEVSRILRPGGIYLKIHLDSSDDYYLQRSIEKRSFGHISYDPANQFLKRHYGAEKLHDELRSNFDLMRVWRVRFDDVVRGAKVSRSVFAIALTRKPHE